MKIRRSIPIRVGAILLGLASPCAFLASGCGSNKPTSGSSSLVIDPVEQEAQKNAMDQYYGSKATSGAPAK